jgi:hypothetical protein
VSFLDSLLGRDKPIKSKTEALFALTTAQLTIQTTLNMSATNRAAVSFRPVSTADWSGLESEMESLLKVSTQDAPLTWKWFTDEFEFKWAILEANEFENLIATTNMIGDELTDHGYGDQLLAAIVQFKDGDGKSVYLIYNYKRGAWYPFVPDPARNHERLNAEEFRISGTLAKDLPIEKEVESWYPLWGVPL